jgi:sigma-B regulation protein RsbU (phosphoserine phosphatase)
LLVLYSEGLRSDPNARGEAFGTGRLHEAIRAAAAAGAEGVVAEVMTRLAAFLGGKEPADDLTLLVVQRDPDADPRAKCGVCQNVVAV